MNPLNETAVFVIPHYGTYSSESKRYLDKTLEGIFNQTDENWRIMIIDDFSPCSLIKDYLKELTEKFPGKINVIFNPVNEGAGVCRNLGIKWAYEKHAPFILFNDADDISHPRRLETVRKIFNAQPDTDVIYSTFKVIDENDNIVPREKITSVYKILEAHEYNPPQGADIWKITATETGDVNLTSTTSVRTELAYKCPFPSERAGEDSHTWLRYSARGGIFVYCPSIPSFYRIPQNTDGSSSRSREGGKGRFYSKASLVYTEGFKEALKIAQGNCQISQEEADELLIKFYIRYAKTFIDEKETGLALEQFRNAISISEKVAMKIIKEKGLDKICDDLQRAGRSYQEAAITKNNRI